METKFDLASEAPHVGAAHHTKRTIGWLVSGVLFAALLGGYLAYEHKINRLATEKLDRFEALYTQSCDELAFDSSEAKLRRTLYVGSPMLERAVTTELAALQRGASCEDVWKALRAVDFPVAPLPEKPTSMR